VSAIRKYIKVWVLKRKNNPREGDKAPTVSRTLHWLEDGVRKFQSLGRHATADYAREAARRKEAELNNFDHPPAPAPPPLPLDHLKPITWDEFRRKYLDIRYPGHDLPTKQRKEAAKTWSKSWTSCRSERLALDNFGRLVMNAEGRESKWVHEVTTEDRDRFVTARMAEVPSAASVETDLRVLRAVFNVAKEWKHTPEGRNPFAGKGNATVGSRRKRQKERQREELAGKKEMHYRYEEIKAILALATKEAAEASDAEHWHKRRLRALVYFVAYTGCRFSEAVHLEWKDIDFDKGIAWLYFKVENDLKTEGSQAPFGLPDRVIEVLKEWQKDQTCSWVFPNERKKPWKAGGKAYRPFDQLKALGERAGVKGANFKRFRHSLSTHGKQRFGMTTEQVRAQLRHTTEETQKHYTHDDQENLRRAVKKVDFEE
jgi:integrase